MQKRYKRLTALLLALMMLTPLLSVGAENTSEILSDNAPPFQAEPAPAEKPEADSTDETLPPEMPLEVEETNLPETSPMEPEEMPPEETEAPAESEPPLTTPEEPVPTTTEEPVQPSEETASPDAETELPPDETDSPPPVAESAGIADMIATNGHAYVVTSDAAEVYATPEMLNPVFTLTQESAVLLATGAIQQDSGNALLVWFLTNENEAVSGYISEATLTGIALSDEEAYALTASQPAGIIASDAGQLIAFVVEGHARNDVLDNEVLPTEPANPTSDQPQAESPASDPPPAQPGDFRMVTTQTRAYESIDESEDGCGESLVGFFTRDASVQVEAVERDGLGRWWYRVGYLYGDTFADGTLKWTESASLYVLADETAETEAQEFTLTDYAYPAYSGGGIRLLSAPMNGFSLKTINAPVPSLHAGQTDVYGSSGRDSDYLQIAKAPGHGTVYATPHYLDGYTVYCLEHTLPGPGENISGGGQQPSGPYVIVDMDAYRTNPGYSSIIYHDSTLHAIGWVLRHSYPFMVLDRGDSDNETWSRVAGQFAIRQVIRELEGAQYVRDYWDLDNFYRASGQAPEVYLDYARWLAEGGIARAGMTGRISVTNKSSRYANGSLTGTVTLTTDADLIRISKSAGTVTGHTAGEDGSYYYLHSGDTITVSAPGNRLTLAAESMSSEEEEARFLVGVPSAAIQKVLIPQYGAPYALQSVSITFDVPLGAVSVRKKDAASGAALAGAVFELISGGTVLQTQTTGADGTAIFANLQPGSYVVREAGAPEGYLLSATGTQSVTVTSGNVSGVTFLNAIQTAKIRIVKKDQLTKEPLAGAEFTVTRLSAPASQHGAGVGEVAAVLTTDANGVAETGWLDWGRYRIEETRVPAHYVNKPFSTEIDAYEDGHTYEITAENEPTKGFIRLTKTDRRNGNPIQGVRFDIYYNDAHGSGLAGFLTTDENGVAVSEPLRKGKYIVREHGETAGYVFEEITLDAEVKSDETTELAATNLPVMARLKLYKRDAEEFDGNLANASTRGDGVLSGAEFQVLAGANITDRQGNLLYAKGDVVIPSLKTSGEEASVTTDALWPGLYEIVELTPPMGYQPSRSPIRVDARDAAKQSREAEILYEGVVTNLVLYGALEIVKFLGDNQEHVGTGVVETPEKDAEFEVYLKSAGSYEAARAFERDVLKTNRYGKAKTTALPYGVYVLRQVAGREGHALMAPMEFMIDGTENPKDPPTLILNNQAIRYRLRIVKVDGETGQPIALANTAFRLRDASGSYVTQIVRYPTQMEIDTFLTDETGSVTLPETVVWGQYFIEEIRAPEGYLLNAEDVPVFVGRVGDDAEEILEVTVTVPNTPVKGRISLEKKGLRLTGFEAEMDDYGNEVHEPIYENGYLAGAVFEVRAAEEIIGREGTLWYGVNELVETLTTTADGPVKSRELPLGRYHLVEAQTPTGYIPTDEPYEAALASTDSETAVVEVTAKAENKYLPAEILLKKEKESLQTQSREDGTVRQVLVNTPGEGFVFGLYSAQDFPSDGGVLPADSLVDTGVTGVDGCLTFSGNYPHGRYYVKELAAPDGWKLAPERFGIVLDPENASDAGNLLHASLDVHNELIYTTITLTKTDITGQQPLPGALIEVENEAGEVLYRAYTDVDGQIPDIPVTPGRYSFREVLAPDGYALNEAAMHFTVHADGSITGDTVIRDESTRFLLRKQDGDEQPLAGVEFALLKEDGTRLLTSVSDENGRIVFERIPYGHYTIVETQALPGYLPSDTEIRLTVDGAYINPSEPVVVVNVPNHYAFLKTDNEGKPLAGVKFALEDVDGNPLRELVSGEDGVVYVEGLSRGTYRIRETEALEGYIRSEEVIELVIDNTYTPPEELYRLVNYPGIQTGVDVPITPGMRAGAALVAAAGVLAAAHILSRKKRKKRKAPRKRS